MTYRLTLPFLLFSLVLFGGCGGPAKPAGFPDLVRPVTVKVHKDGVPLEGIMVSLHQKGETLPFNISGLTRTDGVATLQTSRNTYVKPGVPVGTFVVQLSETIEVDMSDFRAPTQTQVVDGVEVPDSGYTRRAAEARAMEHDRRVDALRKIPKAMSSTDQSPLEIEITSSGTFEFDVSRYLLMSATSGHPGGVNGLLFDGSGRFFSETIDTGSLTVKFEGPNAVGESPYGVWGAMGSINPR